MFYKKLIKDSLSHDQLHKKINKKTLNERTVPA